MFNDILPSCRAFCLFVCDMSFSDKTKTKTHAMIHWVKWPECLRTKLGICPVVTLMAGVNYTLKNHTCDHFIFKLTTKFSNMTLYTCLTFATSIHRSLLSSFSSWAASPYIPAAKQARWSILCSSLPYLRICKGWNFFWTTKVFAQKISRRQWFAEMIREVQNRNPGLPKSKRASFWQIWF